MAKEKKIAVNKFTEGVNSDTADNLLDPSFVRFMLNCRLFEIGSKGVIKLVKGTTQIAFTPPAGDNICLGWGSNEERSKFYWFNWNSNLYHGCYCYNDIDQTVTPVIQNLTDTNDVDIFNFDPDSLINHVDIIQDNLIYWVDGLNKARKFNIDKAVDKSPSGYGTIILEEFITAYKRTSTYAPVPAYFTDLTRPSNYLYGLQFKFAQRYIYDDGEQSNTSDFSVVALPPNESYVGADNITYNNNGINVQVATGSRLVTKIEILVKINDLNWQSCVVLDKSQLQIADNTSYLYAFFNDGPLTAVDNVKVNRPYSFMPRVPYVQSFVKLAMTYGNAREGFSVVPITASVAITSKDLYLPSDTVPQLNTPAFTVSTVSIENKSAGLFSGSYKISKTHFIIGHDVKKGNKFVLTGSNGVRISFGQIIASTDNYSRTVTADYGDSPETIAAIFKQFLRGTGRGIPDYRNGVSNEVTDGSGNVSWDYTYLGHYNTNATTFQGTVNPVNYSTLKDDGLSVNVIKSGSARKYAIVYEDDDGRKSLAYTCDALLAKTPFLTQWGTSALQQPIHTITIQNLPPVWAANWQLVRTQDITDFTQMLIQKVIEVDVTNDGQYLDLVIGSIFTYQLIHPNTVITYEFLKGDRLRLIKNEQTGDLYTPYYETEVLSYKDVVTQVIDSNIVCDGTAEVQPENGVKADYIGKNIVINGTERTIGSIDGAKYVLNEPINPTKTYTTDVQTSSTFPNYTIIDRRGILRINKPPAGYNFQDFSTIEIYHPQKTLANDQRQNFMDFSKKFPILNPGTAQASHVGNINNSSGTPNQDPDNPATVPAIVQVTDGDAYFRQRALPTNTPTDPQEAQVIIDTVEDPNFSDFYQSNLYSLGRVFPQDDGAGEKLFEQRERFSSNYIQDTRINGLNDFDDLNRKDYNDPYGAIMLSRFRRNYLFLFKQLKTTWTAVKQRRITSNSGEVGLATSDDLLNDLEYSVWEGGIGNKGCWFENGDYQYISSANSGVFLRIAQDGSIPISSIYFYDKTAREFLSTASNNNLQIRGQFDKLNDEAIFSYLPFIIYLFKGGFNPAQWQTSIPAYPDGTTFTITQQPANATASVVDGQIQITGTNTLGDDFFLYEGNLPGGGTTDVMRLCFTVVDAPDRPTAWVQDTARPYCVTFDDDNTGEQGWEVLIEQYTDTSAATGFIMPNIYMISSQAIVPNTATITFNEDTDIAPTGGADGDIWYNAPGDALYKRIAGVWTVLTDRLINVNYIAPIENTTDCPVTPPSASTININNTTGDFTISFVKVFLGATLVYSRTNIGPGSSVSDSLPVGTYTVNVKTLPSTDGGSATLTISSDGTPTTHPVPGSGTDVSQSGVLTPIIVQIDP